LLFQFKDKDTSTPHPKKRIRRLDDSPLDGYALWRPIGVKNSDERAKILHSSRPVALYVF
jgi:hypothetical protein